MNTNLRNRFRDNMVKAFAADPFISMLGDDIRGKLADGFVKAGGVALERVRSVPEADYFKPYLGRAVPVFPLAFLTDDFKDYLVVAAAEAAIEALANESATSDLAARMNGEA